MVIMDCKRRKPTGCNARISDLYVRGGTTMYAIYTMPLQPQKASGILIYIWYSAGISGHASTPSRIVMAIPPFKCVWIWQ